MSEEIVFAKPGHPYDSYTDFWRLVELAGFPIIHASKVDITRHCTYITAPHNGDWNPIIDNQRVDDEGRERIQFCNLILWNIERPDVEGGGVGGYSRANWNLMYGRKVDRVWVSDRELAKETGLHYAVLGSHPDLGQPGAPEKKIWDMTHISALNGRRATVLNDLSKFQTYDPQRQDDVISHNCWPPQRDKVLEESRFALNVHKDEYPFSEPLRFALFAANALPILSEKIYDAYPYGSETMAFAEWHDLANVMRRMLTEDYEQYRAMGQRCREMMTVEYEFGKMVRKAVRETVGGMWER